MSFNQSRLDKNETTQYRKTGRLASSNQPHRGYSSAHPKGTAAPAGGPAFNRSFKKNNNNAQGGQSRASVVAAVNPPDSGVASTQQHGGGVPNGAHVHPQLHGRSDAPVPSAAPRATEASAPQRSSLPVPKAPTSQSPPLTSDSRAPTTPAKPPGGETPKGFPFQFGSISPSFMNGMQVPARTSSAPPNLDEQKFDQARRDSLRTVPSVPTPTVPKQQLPRKDPASIDQPNADEAHMVPKVKKDVQVSHAPPVNQTQKHSAHPISGISMPMPFHQQQVPMQFSGPNQHIQSQGMSANSLQMPIPVPLPIGSTQVQQPMFVPGLHSHPMQTQGILHQGQNLTFPHQMGAQIPQLGNMGISIAPQYPQQQGGKFSGPGPRKTPVKITHPDTHEELRLDKRTDSYSDGGPSAPRTHPNVTSQSQPLPSFAPSHPTSYYTSSYNPSSLFFPPPSSNPLTSSHMPPSSQAPRFSYPVSQGPQNVPFIKPSAHNVLPVNKSGGPMHNVVDPPSLVHARDVHNISVSVPSATIPVVVKAASGTVAEKIADPLPNSSAAVEKGELSKPSRSSGEISQSHPQRYPELSTDGLMQQSKPSSDQSLLKSLPVTVKPSAGMPAAVSVEIHVSNPLSSASAAPTEESLPVVTTSEPRRKESLSRSTSIKDQQKKPGKKGNIQPQHQVVGQPSSISSFSSRATEHGTSSSIDVSGSVEANTTLSPVSNEPGSESAKKSLPDVIAATADGSESKAEAIGESTIPISSEKPVPGIVGSLSNSVHHSKLDNFSPLNEQGKHDSGGAEKQVEQSLSENYKQDANSSGISAEPISVKPVESVKEKEAAENSKDSAVATSETAQGGEGQHEIFHAEIDGSAGMGSTEVALSKPSKLDQHSDPLQTTEHSGTTSKSEGISGENTGGGGGNIENIGSGGDPLTVSGSKDKPLPELSRSKSTTSKGKKKRKEILSKADAAGVTLDLYGAYKNPEDKKGIVSSESAESTTMSIISKQLATDAPPQEAFGREEDTPSKAEPDDWEDAADISTPKLETSDNGEQVRGGVAHSDKDGHGHGAKKYSRDFLLKFSVQFTELPEGFAIMSDIAEILNANINTSPSIDYDSLPSPGRIIDRSVGATRIDRRGSGMIDDDRWNKGGAAANFRPAQGVNYGVLRNPRGQPPVQQFVRGILPGPTQSVGPQGGMQRNNSDADRWQRATNFQPKATNSHTPSQIMHKAERKYEVGKVSDEEQAKQRQLKAILNKLTPQNFEKLFEQVKAVNIDNATTLTGVISQIFDKALMEPTFCEMYANFCCYLSGELPDFSEDNEKITFKRLLLNKCQEEFERGEREQEEANKADEEGEAKQSEEVREEKRIKARRRMLGNIRLIGELYKKKMLTERIMHECIKKLLGQQQTPDEEDIEALCKLMSTIGEMIDHPRAKEFMDAYFERMKSLSNNMKLSSRVRFMLKDSIDLRKNKWQQRRKVEGPKKIEEVHRDAAQERQAQASRLSRGPGINPSARRTPMEFSPRGSTMSSSPNAQMGGFRGMPPQARGYGSQDARTDERHSYESRTLSVPLTQRPIGDDTITLGPQGGLARGMSRGPPSMLAAPLAEISPSVGDSRRMTAGLNGFSSHSERPTYNPREDPIPRYIPDRFAGPAAYDQSTAPERNVNFGGRDPRNSDRSFNRSLPTSPPTGAHGSALAQNVPPEKVMTEDDLRDMSLAAIKEFYSARDEKEVVLCINDLNSPSFHPSMISLWVTDSFERKDTERDLLAKLLVNLTKSHDGTLSQSQLIKGFETVLSTLEDAVKDAPKAPEFLGLIFAKVILENVVPLTQIGQIIYEGGEEPGHLVEVGLADNVLGNVLEIIKSEKGDRVLNEIRTTSKLRLETFRPRDPHKSRILEKFI